MNSNLLPPVEIQYAYERIKDIVTRTPIVTSKQLNEWLGHKVYFKLENHQILGSFKTRGAINALLSLKERGVLPKKIVAYSSGNHAQSVAWAAKKMGILAQIYLSANSSEYKRNLAKNLGAEIIITNTRQEAEDQAVASINKETYFLHPSNNPLMVAGIGTACFEALQELKSCDAIFASCGGGGLLAGTYLASKALSPGSKIYAAEPLQANDAALSYQSGKIVRFQESPITIADGARTLGVAEEIFGYLKQLNGFYLISEDEIKYWTRWISHLLEIKCEPTSALAMAAACKWLKEQQKVSEVLVIISGGNIDPEAHDEIWGNNYLEKLPNNV